MKYKFVSHRRIVSIMNDLHWDCNNLCVGKMELEIRFKSAKNSYIMNRKPNESESRSDRYLRWYA